MVEGLLGKGLGKLSGRKYSISFLSDSYTSIYIYKNSSNNTEDLCALLNVNYTALFKGASSSSCSFSHCIDKCLFSKMAGPLVPGLWAIVGIKWDRVS